MFTGLIESTGNVKRLVRRGADAVIEIDSSLDLGDVAVGDSIAVSGACLTVTARNSGSFSADVSAENLAKTNLKSLRPGDKVNLEKSLRLQSFLGGHLVLGHVDGIGKISRREVKSNSIVFGIEVEDGLRRYIVEKGSIAVDGVSLTVNSLGGKQIFRQYYPPTRRNIPRSKAAN